MDVLGVSFLESGYDHQLLSGRGVLYFSQDRGPASIPFNYESRRPLYAWSEPVKAWGRTEIRPSHNGFNATITKEYEFAGFYFTDTAVGLDPHGVLSLGLPYWFLFVITALLAVWVWRRMKPASAAGAFPLEQDGGTSPRPKND